MSGSNPDQIHIDSNNRPIGAGLDPATGKSANLRMTSVTQASDGEYYGNLVVAQAGGGFADTATPSNVAASASSVQLLASNSSRKGMSVYNDGSANMYINYGATASTSAFVVKVPPNNLFEMPLPVYTGVINAIWDSATGTARILELS